jgi:hypothetical protein
MRELLPHAVPGKTLEQCTAAELIQLIVRRHTERAIRESHLGDSFISDGSSLQEWAYGSIRVIVGINPNDSIHLGDLENVARTAEIGFFEEVLAQLGAAFKEHVKDTYQMFAHLPNELALEADGHRPVSERFRALADQLIGNTVDELGIPRHVVGGPLPERLNTIAGLFGLTPVTDIDAAIASAYEEYRALDRVIESDRAQAFAS